MQLICELLVNDTPPSAVPCQVVLQNLNETLATLRLGRSEEWFQLFPDGTSHQQIAMQNLVIALRENGQLNNVIVSSCITLKDETSEN